MNTNENQARLAYDIIGSTANKNTVIQAASGFFGFIVTLGVDAAVIPTIYGPLLNDLRRLYGHPDTPDGTVATLVPQIVKELLADLLLDKILGGIPIAGVYFNAICAKAFTWRLGILFAMLSSRGPDIPSKELGDAVILIRECFPQSGMFSFSTPDRQTFMTLVTSVKEVSETDFQRKINSALAAIQS